MDIKHFSNYRLTTAEILYFMPDYPKLLQSYIWQDYDLAPYFPTFHQFLDFWDHHLEGKRHSVTLAYESPFKRNGWRQVTEEYHI